MILEDLVRGSGQCTQTMLWTWCLNAGTMTDIGMPGCFTQSVSDSDQRPEHFSSTGANESVNLDMQAMDAAAVSAMRSEQQPSCRQPAGARVIQREKCMYWTAATDNCIV